MLNLKFARMKKGLTQKQLAELMNVEYATISRWETGVNNISSNKLIQLSKILDVSVDYLLGLEGE